MTLSITKVSCCRHALIAWSVLTAVLAACPIARADEITVTRWDLGVLVYGDGMDQDFNVVVQNPYDGSLIAAPPGHASSAASQHQFSWAGSIGTFLTQSQEQATGQSASSVRTLANGGVLVAGSVDLPLHVAASYSYALPVDFMMARLDVDVRDDAQPVYIFNEHRTAQTLPGEPASGTFTIEGDTILPAGHTWRMTYNFEVDAFSGTSGYTGTGEGSVSFQITPEMSTAALLLCVLPLMCRRSRRRRRA